MLVHRSIFYWYFIQLSFFNFIFLLLLIGITVGDTLILLSDKDIYLRIRMSFCGLYQLKSVSIQDRTWWGSSTLLAKKWEAASLSLITIRAIATWGVLHHCSFENCFKRGWRSVRLFFIGTLCWTRGNEYCKENSANWELLD